MNDAELNQLLEIARRRPLRDEEEARLTARLRQHPEIGPLWEEEAGLTRLLHELPDAPVSSNLTARIISAVERETAGSTALWPAFRWLRLPRPLGRLAIACALLAFVPLGYHQYQASAREKRVVALTHVARNVAVPAELVELPAIELWRDFDAIDLLGKTEPPADEELLVGLALQ